MSRGEYIDQDHPSDALLRLSAPDLAELYSTAARACFSVMTELSSVRPAGAWRVDCEASDREELLVVWLNELVGLSAAERLFFCEFEVSVEGGAEGESEGGVSLHAIVRGEPIHPERHPLYQEVKAATYHELSVRPTGDGWEASVLLDL